MTEEDKKDDRDALTEAVIGAAIEVNRGMGLKRMVL
jgi:hypothetical protein